MEKRPPNPTSDPLIVAAGDVGYRRDASALIVARREEQIVRVVDMLELYPKKGQPLTPSGVAAAFAVVMRKHRVFSIVLDGFGIDGAIESFGKEQISVMEAPAGAEAKVRSYHHLRELMSQKRLRLPLSAVRLRAQLKSIVSKPTSGGGLSISAPRRGTGGHGDAVSALVLACWAAGNVSDVPASAWAEVVDPGRWADSEGRGF